MNQENILITKSGLEKHQAELKKLKEEDRPLVLQHLQEARALGDLSENADYDAVRAEQGRLEARIRELEIIIENATIINDDEISTDTAKMGLSVTFERLDNKKKLTYKLVGTTEVDLEKNHISIECALGKALAGSKVGEVKQVSAKTPYQVKILKIELVNE